MHVGCYVALGVIKCYLGPKLFWSRRKLLLCWTKTWPIINSSVFSSSNYTILFRQWCRKKKEARMKSAPFHLKGFRDNCFCKYCKKTEDIETESQERRKSSQKEYKLHCNVTYIRQWVSFHVCLEHTRSKHISIFNIKLCIYLLMFFFPAHISVYKYCFVKYTHYVVLLECWPNL